MGVVQILLLVALGVGECLLQGGRLTIPLQSTHEKRIVSLEGMLKKLRGEVDDLLSVVADLNERKSETGQTNVAFQANLWDSTMYVKGCVRLRFKKILINAGGGYSSTSGYFTVPVSGIYLLWAHVMNSTSARLIIDVMKSNGRILARGVTEKGSGAVASISIAVHAKKGERLCFSKDGESNRIRGRNYSSFGGVLVSAD